MRLSLRTVGVTDHASRRDAAYEATLDLIDNVVDDWTSNDSMRWMPDPSANRDLRRPIFQAQPPERQAKWEWWCPTCEAPLPQPRWRTCRGVGMVPFHEAMNGRWHRIEKRRLTNSGGTA